MKSIKWNFMVIWDRKLFEICKAYDIMAWIAYK